MSKEMTALKFYFRNGETWTINRRHIGDLGSNKSQQVLDESTAVNLLKSIRVPDLKSKSSMKGTQLRHMIST